VNDISLPKLAVLGSEVAYREAGGREAPAALLLHGNPTSAYIWRNIIPPSPPRWRTPDVVATLEKASAALAASTDPKLLSPPTRARSSRPLSPRSSPGSSAGAGWPGLGQGVHFLQEDHPETIRREVSAFIAEAEGLRDDERKARGLPYSTLIDPAHRFSRLARRRPVASNSPAAATLRPPARTSDCRSR